ncbi:hypothetical protein ACHAXS_006576 [Conticribra weissflogii]
MNEWELLWQEFENLFGCKTRHDNEGTVLREITRGNSSSSQSIFDVGIEVIDVDDDDVDAGEADIASIARAVQSTQQTNRSEITNPSYPRIDGTSVNWNSKSNQQSQSTDGTRDTQHEVDGQRRRVGQQQPTGGIESILRRLRQVHTEIIEVQFARPINGSSSSKTLHHLKSKIRNLQSTLCDLRNENQSLQAKNSDLKLEIDQANQNIFSTSLECERAKTKFEKLKVKYDELRSTHRSQQAKSLNDITKLQESNRKLHERCKTLENEKILNNIEEMENIRQKYSRMSQELHDARRKNALMENQMMSDKRDWERKLDLERRRGDERLAKIQNQMDFQRKKNMVTGLIAKQIFDGNPNSGIRDSGKSSFCDSRITSHVSEPMEKSPDKSSSNGTIKTRGVSIKTSVAHTDAKHSGARCKAIDALDKAPSRKSRVPLKRKHASNQRNIQDDCRRSDSNQADNLRERNRVSQLFVDLDSDSSDDVSLEIKDITSTTKAT